MSRPKAKAEGGGAREGSRSEVQGRRLSDDFPTVSPSAHPAASSLTSAFVIDLHESGTLCPASTQMYSHAKLPASARTAPSDGDRRGAAGDDQQRRAARGRRRPWRRPRRGGRRRPRRMASTASSWWRVGLGVSRCSAEMMPRCTTIAPSSVIVKQREPIRRRGAPRRAAAPRRLRPRPARADRSSRAVPARGRARVPARTGTRCSRSPERDDDRRPDERRDDARRSPATRRRATARRSRRARSERTRPSTIHDRQFGRVRM